MTDKGISEKKEEFDSVGIIILNWNRWRDTAECVQSCRKLRYPNYRIIVVDNGSTDGSDIKLKEMFPDLELINIGKNLGFAGGNNVGIRHFLAIGVDKVWILNNDTVVDENSLSELVTAAQSDQTIGIVGSKIFYYDRPDVIWFAGGYIDYKRAVTGHRGQDEKDSGQYDEMAEVDYITGCSILVKSETIRRAGLMDERFFLLFEETDWNQRIRRAGYKIVYAPLSKVWHKISKSIGYDSPMYHYYLFRNSLLFTEKHNPRLLPIVFVRKIKSILTLYLRSNVKLADSALQGVIAYSFRSFGKAYE